MGGGGTITVTAGKSEVKKKKKEGGKLIDSGVSVIGSEFHVTLASCL